MFGLCLFVMEVEMGFFVWDCVEVVVVIFDGFVFVEVDFDFCGEGDVFGVV